LTISPPSSEPELSRDIESEGDADVAPTSETIRVPDAVLTVRRGDFAGVFALLRESASYLKEI
jgi:hypothetical protein